MWAVNRASSLIGVTNCMYIIHTAINTGPTYIFIKLGIVIVGTVELATRFAQEL